MKTKKLFLLLFVMMSTNALADGGLVISNDFPANDLMQENHVYKNSAVFGNMGVYDGTVNAVAMYDDLQVSCARGYYLPADAEECTICSADNYCPGGTYTFNETIAQGITACGAGLYAPAGMWEPEQCGRILHVGDGFVYLRATKKTEHALNVDLNHDGIADYFGNMTTLDVPMSSGTQRKLKVRMNGVVYSIYDDSVDLSLYGNE